MRFAKWVDGRMCTTVHGWIWLDGCMDSVQFCLLFPKWHDIIIKQHNASWRDTTGDSEATKVPLI